MTARFARCAPLLAVLATACAAAPPPADSPPAASPAASAAPAADEGTAQKAAGVAIAALSKRSFDTDGCAAAEARVVGEAEARAGTDKGDRCTVLVARLADGKWLVAVRSSLPSKSVGAQARVTVAPEAQGITGIEYAP